MAKILLIIEDNEDGTFDIEEQGDTLEVKTDAQIFAQMVMCLAQASKESIGDNIICKVENIGK